MLGEPAIKMLRYQQQFSFFDMSKIDGAIRFVNLSQLVLDNDLAPFWTRSSSRSRPANAKIVVVDSFRTVVRRAQAMASGRDSQQRNGAPGLRPAPGAAPDQLAGHLFLIGEYVEGELRDNPVFTVADGLFWLYQSVERNSIVRKMQVMKMRGQESVPGMHTFRITDDGLQTFPRTFGLSVRNGSRQGQAPPLHRHRQARCHARRRHPRRREHAPGRPLRLGQVNARHAVHRRGPASRASRASSPSSRSCPKSTSTAPRCSASTSTRPRKTASSSSSTCARWTSRWMKPFTRSSRRVKEIGCKRLVIDSLVGFEMALAPGFREDFRESLYRMIAALTRLGVTIISTVEIEEDFTSMDLSQVHRLVPGRRHPADALRLDQRPVPQDADGGEDAPQPALDRHARVPDHLRRVSSSASRCAAIAA